MIFTLLISGLEIPRRPDWLQLELHLSLPTLILGAILIFVLLIALVPTYRVRAEIAGTLGIIFGALLILDGAMSLKAVEGWAERNTLAPEAALQQVSGVDHFLDALASSVDAQTYSAVYTVLRESKSFDDVQRAASRLIMPDLRRFELMNIESEKEKIIESSSASAQQEAYRLRLSGHLREGGGAAVCLFGAFLLFAAHRIER